MIVQFLRSSSYGTHKLCPFQFFLTYGGLNWSPPSNMAADRGSIIHKALEILARAKLCRQRGETSFVEPELAMTMGAGVSPEEAMDFAFRHYSEGPASHHRWTLRDRDECERLMRVAFTHGGGAYDPRNRTVVQPEQFFDIELTEPWAAYEYAMPDGTVARGNLRLKGTVDLVLEGAEQGSLEYVDWKSGRMVDWATGRPKSVDDLYEDFQLRLYYYALTELYPAHDVLMTIFYLRNGPYTLAFERDENAKTLERIRTWFETVKRDHVPERRIGPPCRTFCKFGTTAWRDQPYVPAGTDGHGDHLSVCDHVHAEVQQLGVDRVVAKYASGRWGYGGGGGVTNRE